MTTPLLIDYEACATALGLDSPNWLQEHISELPHVRLGKYVRFSADNLAQIIRTHTVLPAAAELPSSASDVPVALLELRPGRAPRGRQSN
ncbi:hypothetical protein [Kitasatospora viridis]|uniref:Excisionase family DNA binding protein n=1 Tax=Kitasatospora viridis TaxID=281105 RepID=A0A561UKS0_9ACTN|nr:hypothetical protein [Kitasatospora viridis]TWF99957.1 hypothetical protein FHX73_113817 [Kitasatospora viridis]